MSANRPKAYKWICPALGLCIHVNVKKVINALHNAGRKRRRNQHQTSISIITAEATVKTFGYSNMEFVHAMLQYVLEQIEQREASLTKAMAEPVHGIVTAASPGRTQTVRHVMNDPELL